MAIQAMTNQTPSETASNHLQALLVNLPDLPEPQRGAILYAFMVAQNPALDETVCQQAGKLVQITARLSQKVDHPITIRGNAPLDWNTDWKADLQGEGSSFFERTFTLFVPPERIKDTLEFKLCLLSDGIRWQTGNNHHVDLKSFGHIVKIELNGISFNQ
jgi:hypothetical protein